MWFALFMWAVSFVLTDYFRPKLPAQTPSGNGEFGNPTATEGRYVPLMFGTIRNEAPNVIWHGDFLAVERTVSTGVIFKRDETIGYTYNLAIALGLCRGRSAGVTGIWISDDKVWDYVADNSGNPGTVCDVNLPDLFGGTDQGGGFIGRFRLFNGDPLQAKSAFLDTPSRIDPLSAFRGFNYIVMTDLAETLGAEIGESNIMREVRIELQMFDTVANGGLGDSLSLGNDHHFIGRDLNPIALHYQTWVDTDWGEAIPAADLNLASFQAAAETIWTEGLGYSQLIDNVQDVGALRDSIEQHIDGYIGPNPITGEIEVTLSRSGYNPATEFQADASNVKSVPKWSRAEWSETNNEVLLQFTNRDKNYDDGFAPAQDLANLAIQGRPRSRTVRMSGVHDPSVANAIVWRLLKQFSRPMASGQVILDRSAYALRPGGILVLTDADTEVVAAPCRITRISTGDMMKNDIVVDIVEDIFGNETKGNADPPASDYIPPSLAVIAFAAADQVAMEAPYIINRQDPVKANIYPRIYAFNRVTGSSGGAMTEYETISRVGNPPAGSYVSNGFTNSGGMLVGTLRNAETDWASGNGGKTIQVDPIAGSLDALIGVLSPGTGNMQGVCVIDPAGANEEWVIARSIVDDGSGVRLEDVYRGALDTAWRSHSAGERIWFIWTGNAAMPDESFARNVDIQVKMLPKSPTDEILEAGATAMTTIDMLPDGRYERPLLPAYLSVDGVQFPSQVDFDTVLTTPVAVPDAQGVAFAPFLRDWRWQDPLGQMQGAQTGNGFESAQAADEYELEYWLYNLDTHPSPVRGNAIATAVLSAQSASVTFAALKEAIRTAVGNNNTFNARLEVEASHEPVGVVAGRKNSRDIMFWDFIGNGTWVLPFGSVHVHMQADGQTGSRPADLSKNNFELKRFNLDSGVSTAQSVFGGASMIAGYTTPFTINTAGGVKVEGGSVDLKDIDWTIEFRLRLEGAPSTAISYLMGMYSPSLNWYITYTGNTTHLFRITGSTIGNAGLQNIIVTLADFTLAGDTWYSIAISYKSTGAGTGIFTTFINGVGQTTGDVSFNIYNTALGNLEIGLIDTERSFSDGLATAGLREGWMDEVRIIPGLALYVLDYTPAVAAFAPDLLDYIVFQSSFDSTISDDMSKETFVFNGACRLSSAQAKFGFSCLEIDGGDEVGLEVGTSGQRAQQAVRENDFTAEGFVRFKVLPSTEGNDGYMCGVWTVSSSQREWGGGIDTNGDLAFSYSENGTAVVTVTGTPGGALVVDTWYHLAFVRHGRNIYGYLDGVRLINAVDQLTAGVSLGGTLGANGNLSIGKLAEDESGATTSKPMNGFVDEFRMTKHDALYTGASLTVPTEPYPKPYTTGRLIDQPAYANIGFHSHFEQDDSGDPLWSDVVALLEFEGTDTDTTTTDESVLGVTWTFNGDAQIDSAQAAIGSTSLLLDGAGDYLETPDVPDFDLGANPFTIECFVRWGTAPAGNGDQVFVAKWNPTGNQRSWLFWWDDSDDHLAFDYSSSGTNTFTASVAWSPSADTWYHIAVTSNGADIYFYVDGLLIGTNTNNTNCFASSSTIRIGRTSNDTGDMNGWIDQVRITKSFRYQPMGYVVPSAALPQTWGGDLFLDESDNGHLISGVNDPVLSTAQSKFGGMSLLLDGVDQYAFIPDSVSVELSSVDFTIEAQIRMTNLPTSGNRMTVLGKWDNDQSDKEWHLSYDADDGLVFEYTTNGSTVVTINGAWSASTNTWYHVAAVRRGQWVHLFVDGVRVGLAFNIATASIGIDTEVMTIGALYGSTTTVNHFDGHIDEARVIVGESRWIADFTAPTKEYDYHRNVFVMGDNMDIWLTDEIKDVSKYLHTRQAANQMATVNDFLKFSAHPNGGYGKIGHFGNGSGYVAWTTTDEFRLLNYDFTIDGWIYLTGLGTQYFIADYDATGNNRSWFVRFLTTADTLEFGWYDDDGTTLNLAFCDFSAVATSTWYHIAVTREGDTIRLFIDGVLQTLDGASDSLTTNEIINVTANPLHIGTLDYSAPSSNWAGRGFDLRVMRGKALYTGNFTPPTTYLQRYD